MGLDKVINFFKGPLEKCSQGRLCYGLLTSQRRLVYLTHSDKIIAVMAAKSAVLQQQSIGRVSVWLANRRHSHERGSSGNHITARAGNCFGDTKQH